MGCDLQVGKEPRYVAINAIELPWLVTTTLIHEVCAFASRTLRTLWAILGFQLRSYLQIIMLEDSAVVPMCPAVPHGLKSTRPDRLHAHPASISSSAAMAAAVTAGR